MKASVAFVLLSKNSLKQYYLPENYRACFMKASLASVLLTNNSFNLYNLLGHHNTKLSLFNLISDKLSKMNTFIKLPGVVDFNFTS